MAWTKDRKGIQGKGKDYSIPPSTGVLLGLGAAQHGGFVRGGQIRRDNRHVAIALVDAIDRGVEPILGARPWLKQTQLGLLCTWRNQFLR